MVNNDIKLINILSHTLSKIYLFSVVIFGGLCIAVSFLASLVANIPIIQVWLIGYVYNTLAITQTHTPTHTYLHTHTYTYTHTHTYMVGGTDNTTGY